MDTHYRIPYFTKTPFRFHFPRLRILVLFFILVSGNQFLHGQYITNVRAEQSDDKVVVYYDIKETKAGQLFNVKLQCSKDGGTTFGSLLQSVTGDVGDGVRGGSAKSITWNVLEDQHELVGDDIVFKITAYPNAISKKTKNLTYELLSCRGEGRQVIVSMIVRNHTAEDIKLTLVKSSSYMLDEMSRQIKLSRIELAEKSINEQIISTKSNCSLVLTFEGIDPTATRISTFFLEAYADEVTFKNVLIER